MDDIVGRREAGPGPGAALEERLARMAAGDASGLVRLALASVLQRLPAASRGKVAAALAGREEDAGDHNLPAMVWYGLTPLVGSDPETVADLAVGTRWERLTRWAARALMDRAESAPGALARLVRKAAAGGDEGRRRAVLEGLVEGSRGRRRVAKPEGWELLVRAAGAGEAEMVRRLESVFGEGVALEELRVLVKDGRAAMGARRQALASLNDARVEDLREICVSVLGVRELAGEAMRGLAVSGNAAAGGEVLAKFRGFDAEGKAAALEMLVSRAEWSVALLEAVRAGKVPRGAVSSYHARQMAVHGNEKLGKLLAEVWGEVRGRPEEKRKRLEALRGELTAERLAKGDAVRGKAVFRVHCGACHTLFGEGGKAGPELTGSGRRQLDYVLPNLVDPSGEVGADYRLVVVRMKDGRVLSGIPAARGEQTLTLRQITGDVTVERREIQKEEVAAESMMPEGLVEAMGVEGLVDLLRYVMGEGD
jgi:putative heme-binding domain-containing protein